VSAPVMPSGRICRRALSWRIFERRFRPIVRADESLMWDRMEIPRNADYRHWWSVLDCDGRLYLSAGFHVVNTIGFVRADTPWGGEAHQHPDYRYD
jgi:hypothetical protein